MKLPIKILINVCLFGLFTATWVYILSQADMADISYLYADF
jgi:hypothetical protein